ncbi:hypothetical protein M8332_00930 [Fructilactobacillus ixorae]|uniref:MFS transporter n=1 Tax=Fructilactobacillus ixorae TaxID=1750535 RepID=A0ABY5C6J6_9LACO|nr:hypothetical protein [Fructilactobacillus ixorae]USS93463.1 hypothetical protein M8332_00930 [Fructilactobacillus ixorae]
MPFNIYSTQLLVNLQRQAPARSLASVTAVSGTLGSVVSLLLLWGVGALDHFQSFPVVAVEAMGLFVLLSGGGYAWFAWWSRRMNE